MSMKNPPHPGGVVGDALEYLGLSVAKGAIALGVSRSQLHRVIKGQCAISPEMALRLEKVIGSTVGSWLRTQAAYDEAQIRKKTASITKGLKRLSVPAKSKKAT
ncbi:MAG: HigA family addiction module antitoxin [Hyphomicrobiales bacterium]|nr:HigA family addiction module antitoxin [Hyphomicrobiales bacterium]MCY4038023.1 HigA family addiction module antitoxin [Hyphomicrobiales bacterium]